jgi:hypothetical protein
MCRKVFADRRHYGAVTAMRLCISGILFKTRVAWHSACVYGIQRACTRSILTRSLTTPDETCVGLLPTALLAPLLVLPWLLRVCLRFWHERTAGTMQNTHEHSLKSSQSTGHPQSLLTHSTLMQYTAHTCLRSLSSPSLASLTARAISCLSRNASCLLCLREWCAHARQRCLRTTPKVRDTTQERAYVPGIPPTRCVYLCA